MNLPKAAVLLLFATAAAAQQPVPCEVVAPMLDANHQVLTAPAPDGKSYPVFQAAPPSKLVEAIRKELATSYAQQALRLDRYARNLVLSKRTGAHGPAEEWLTAPMYFLLSTQDGGFARFGFWLQDDSGNRKLVLAGYVDMLVEEEDCSHGCIEEIFSHELGHLILRTLAGSLAHGNSRKMHQSMTITDYPTAFDEGFAEHFQPLSRDTHANASPGNFAPDFELFWLSAADTQLRTDGVKRNLFIHRKPIPEMAYDTGPDLYRLFIDAETSTMFLPTELKNGQQMMASEGVISTLLYRFVNDPKLNSHYREASFYRAFLPSVSDRPQDSISAAENEHLKLFAAIASAGVVKADQPPMIRVVEQYAKLFPDEAKRIYSDFITTTWGATVSQPLASKLMQAAAEGGRGDMTAFRHDRPWPLLDSTIAEVSEGKRGLGSSVGPELWIVNSGFKIASAMWSDDRSLPLTINLNTATEPELMTIPGIDVMSARKLVSARNERGFFASLTDLDPILSPETTRRLASMAEQMKNLRPYSRE
jgi:hypothetical protein